MPTTWLLLCLGLAAGGAAVAAWATCACARNAARWGLLDLPGGRKNHPLPTPLVGGLAVIATFTLLCVAGVAAALIYAQFAPEPVPGSVAAYGRNIPLRLGTLFWLLAGAGGLMLLGVVDDRRALGPLAKLAGQLAIVGPVVLFSSLRLSAFLPESLAVPLTLLWFLTVINAVNFLDNMDGLVGGLAAVVAAGLVAVGLLQGQLFVPALGSLLGGCILGFLVYNLWPARVFLGDGGSLPLGFLLAALSVLTTYYAPDLRPAATPAAILTPLLILAVPLYDIATTLWIRGRQRRPFMQGDHSHFSHRLLERGVARPMVVRIIWLLTACTAAAAVLLQKLPGPWGWVSFALVAAVLAVVRLLEGPPADRLAQPGDR